MHFAVKLINGELHHFLFTLLFIIGIVSFLKIKRKHALFIISWFFLLYLTYFSMWFKVYGASSELWVKTGLFLFFYPPLLIFASIGASLLLTKPRHFAAKTLSLVLVMGSIMSFAGYYKGYPSVNPVLELETELIYKLKHYVPPDYVIVAMAPDVITSVNSYTTVNVSLFLNDPKLRDNLFSMVPHRILFLEDYPASHEKALQKKMEEDFILTPYAEFSKGGCIFKLLLVEKKR
jgi:signal transduction histidine kinase